MVAAAYITVSSGRSRQTPTAQLSEALIAALDAFAWPVAVYSSYERTCLTDLAVCFVDLRPAIDAITWRLLDLLPIVRSGVYLREFTFSNSIKSAAPALSPGFGYDNLDVIADGMAASSAFLQMASNAISDPDGIDRLRSELLAYC